MTLTKNKLVSEIGRRTRLKNRDVQLMLETLVEVWAENLAAGERIEIENLFVLEVQIVDRGEERGTLGSGDNTYPAPRYVRRVIMRVSKRLRNLLKEQHFPALY